MGRTRADRIPLDFKIKEAEQCHLSGRQSDLAWYYDDTWNHAVFPAGTIKLRCTRRRRLQSYVREGWRRENDQSVLANLGARFPRLGKEN